MTSWSNMVFRTLGTLCGLLFAAFRGFGFLASYEPRNPPWIRVVYAVAFVATLGGVDSLLATKQVGPGAWQCGAGSGMPIGLTRLMLDTDSRARCLYRFDVHGIGHRLPNSGRRLTRKPNRERGPVCGS